MSTGDSGSGDEPGYNEESRPDRFSLRRFQDDQADADGASASDESGYSSYSDEANEEDQQFINDEEEEGHDVPRAYEDVNRSRDIGRRPKGKAKGKEKGRDREKAHRRTFHEEAEALAQRFHVEREENVQHEYELVEDERGSLKTPMQQWRISLTPNGSRRLFIVAVKPSKEAQVLHYITTRYFSQHGSFPTIYSAYFISPGSGYIFVEALTDPEVLALRNNIPFFLFNRTPRPIPLDEMVGAMSVPKWTLQLLPGQFVRIKRDRSSRTESYKGDLAQVIYADLNSNTAMVKLVPRIDYAQLEQIHRAQEQDDSDGGRSEHRRAAVTISGRQSALTASKKHLSYRPPQAEFNAKNVQDFGGDVNENDHMTIKKGLKIDCCSWDDTYFHRTFAYKQYPFRFLQTTDVNPASDETKRFIDGVGRFERDIPNFERNMFDSLGMTMLSAFAVDDIVRVRRGHEFGGLHVRVIKIKDDLVTVRPLDPDFADQELEVYRTALERFFSEGHHVKIMSGTYAGETGQVLSVDDDGGIANVLLDSHRVTADVPLAQLQPTKEVHMGQKTLGKYALHDPVQLIDHSEGVIFRIEIRTLHVLLTNGQARPVTLDAIAMKRRPQMARDSNGKPIQVGQTIYVEHEGRRLRALVLHTTAHAVFIHAESVHENWGVLAVDPRECQTMTTAARDAGNSQSFAPTFAPDPRRSEMVGACVRITRGPFKGELADVKEADQMMIRVVLHSSGKATSLNLTELGTNWDWIDTSRAAHPKSEVFQRSGRPTAVDPFSEVFKKDGGARKVQAPRPPPEPEVIHRPQPQPTPWQPHQPNYGAQPEPPQPWQYAQPYGTTPYENPVGYRAPFSPYQQQGYGSPYAATPTHQPAYGHASPYEQRYSQ
jgi:transcription elongation factor SPT5